MSSPDARPARLPRRALMAALALTLAGCTLTPVYSPGGAGTKLFGQIRPSDPKTVDDFNFNRRLAERLGPEGDAYRLDYTLRVAVVAQAITPEEITTRYSLNGTADFTLRDSGGGAVTQGRVSSFTSYSTTGTTVATLSAEADARERLARMLADQVVTRLLAAASTP